MLIQYDLVKSSEVGWELKSGDKVLRIFHNKALAMDGLRRMLRREGGSVRIFSEVGSFQFERTFLPFACRRRVPLSRQDH